MLTAKILVRSSVALGAFLLSAFTLLASTPPDPAQSSGPGGSAALQISMAHHGGQPAVSTPASPLPQQPNVYMLPHIASGAGYVTKITVVNTSSTLASGQVNFISQNGQLLSSSVFSLNSGATVRIQTNESDRFGPLTVGWAAAGCDQAVGIHLLFEYIPPGGGPHRVTNAVGFEAAPLLTDFTILVEAEPRPADAAIGRTLGVALANPNNVSANVTMTLMDRYGAVETTTTLVVPAFGQTTFNPQNIEALNEEYGDQNFLGTIAVSSPVPLAAIALEDTYGPFGSVPVMQGRAK